MTTLTSAVTWDGIRQSELPWLALTGRFETPALLVVQDHELGERFVATLKSFGRRVLFLEGEVNTPWEGVGPEPDVVAARYSLRNQLRVGATPEFIVMTSELAQQRWMSDEAFSELCSEFSVDDEIEPLALGQRLLDCGFLRVDRVEEPGTFTVRGGVVECFVPGDRYPLRFDFFGDELESIQQFQIETLAPCGRMPKVSIFPIRDVSFRAQAVSRLETWLRQYGESVAVPTRRIHAYLEDAQAGRYFAGCDALWPVMMGQGVSVLESLSAGRTIYLHEFKELMAHWRERYERGEASFKEARELGDVAVEVSEHFLRADDIAKVLDDIAKVVSLTHFALETSERKAVMKRLFELEDTVSLRRKDSGLGSILEPIVDELKKQLSRGAHVLIAASSSLKAERLRELLREHRLDIPTVEKIPDGLLSGRWERECWSGISGAVVEESFIDVERDLLVLHDGLFFERRTNLSKKAMLTLRRPA